MWLSLTVMICTRHSAQRDAFETNKSQGNHLGSVPTLYLITLHEIHLGSVLPTPFCSGLQTKNPLVTSGSITVSTNESKRLDTLVMDPRIAVYVLHHSISRLSSFSEAIFLL